MNIKTHRIKLHARNLKKVATGNQLERRRVLRRYAFDAARLITTGVLADRGEHTYLVNTWDRSLGRATFSDGNYEQETMGAALDILRKQTGRQFLKDAIFVDVGANIGTSTIPALLDFGARFVLAIEPVPHNFALLRCNLILNSVYENAVCISCAIATGGKDVTIELSSTNSGDNRLRAAAQPGDYGEELRRTITVPARALDDVVREAGIDAREIGLIWVDTQGAEAQVLASSAEVMRYNVPYVIEYWPYALRRAGELDLLHSLISQHFRKVIDIRTGREYQNDELAGLKNTYSGHAYTDVLLIP